MSSAILLVILSQVSFWINKEATPARLIFGSNAVLSLMLLSLGQRKDVPMVSYITAFDIYLTICFFFSFGSVIQYAVVNSLTVVIPKKLLAKVEKACKARDSIKFQKLVRRTNRKHSILSEGTEDDFCSESSVAKPNYKHLWKKSTKDVIRCRSFEKPFVSRHKTEMLNDQAECEEILKLRVTHLMTGDSPVDRVCRVVFPLCFITWVNEIF